MNEDVEVKKYISNLNTIIRSGNPKYVSFVSREYMRHKTENPVIAMVMEDMIKKESMEKGSVYALFIDNDNTINLDAMSDISKINNVSDFLKTVDALSDQDFDFGDISSDDLINEGMQIADEIASEIEQIEDTVDLDSENVEEQVSEKSSEIESNVMGKLAVAGAAATGIMAIINTIRQRISSTISRVKSNVAGRKIQRDEENRQKEEKEATDSNTGKTVEENKKQSKTETVVGFVMNRITGKENRQDGKVDETVNKSDEETSFIPRVDVNEQEAVRQLENKQEELKSRKIEPSTNSVNGTNTQEDDEPDI